SPVSAIDDPGVKDVQRPGILGGREVRACANANISTAMLHELLDRVASFRAERCGLLGAAAAGLNQHVDLFQRAAADILRGDALELKLGRAAQTFLDVLRA